MLNKIYSPLLVYLALVLFTLHSVGEAQQTKDGIITPSSSAEQSLSTTPSSNQKARIKIEDNGSGGQNFNCPNDCKCSLELVDCSGTNLTSIPNMTKLSQSKVDLRNNSIERVDFSLLPLSNLESLDLSKNTIELLSLPSKKLDTIGKLESLDLSSNRISNLSSFSAWKFPSLTSLKLSDNPITEIGSNTFNNTKQLVDLELDDTLVKTIHELAFSPLTNLKNLRMSRLTLSHSLGDKLFAKNRKLKKLNLSYNEFIEVPFALRSVPSIRVLNLNGNFMTSLRQSDFVNRSGLVVLSIDNCPNLTKVDEFAFSNLYNLEHLSLSNNPKLSYISQDAFKSEEQHLPLVLHLTNNNISTMHSLLEFPSLAFREVYLGGNPWDCNCDLKWIRAIPIEQRSLIHCKSPSQFKDMEISQYFLTTDCEALESGYHYIVLTGFLLFLVGLTIAIFIQKNELCRRLMWKDQYGTIYYTKAGSPMETV